MRGGDDWLHDLLFLEASMKYFLGMVSVENCTEMGNAMEFAWDNVSDSVLWCRYASDTGEMPETTELVTIIPVEDDEVACESMRLPCRVGHD